MFDVACCGGSIVIKGYEMFRFERFCNFWFLINN